MTHELAKNEKSELLIKIPDIGVGRSTTTTTRILMELLLEETIHDKMRVLESVIDYLGIEADDFNILKRNDQRWAKLDYDNDEKYSFEREV
jgi:hypothetical protein